MCAPAIAAPGVSLGLLETAWTTRLDLEGSMGVVTSIARWASWCLRCGCSEFVSESLAYTGYTNS